MASEGALDFLNPLLAQMQQDGESPEISHSPNFLQVWVAVNRVFPFLLATLFSRFDPGAPLSWWVFIVGVLLSASIEAASQGSKRADWWKRGLLGGAAFFVWCIALGGVFLWLNFYGIFAPIIFNSMLSFAYLKSRPPTQKVLATL